MESNSSNTKNKKTGQTLKKPKDYQINKTENLSRFKNFREIISGINEKDLEISEGQFTKKTLGVKIKKFETNYNSIVSRLNTLQQGLQNVLHKHLDKNGNIKERGLLGLNRELKKYLKNMPKCGNDSLVISDSLSSSSNTIDSIKIDGQIIDQIKKCQDKLKNMISEYLKARKYKGSSVEIREVPKTNHQYQSGQSQITYDVYGGARSKNKKTHKKRKSWFLSDLLNLF